MHRLLNQQEPDMQPRIVNQQLKASQTFSRCCRTLIGLLLAVTFISLLPTHSALAQGCRCRITIPFIVSVPDSGPFSLTGLSGNIFIDQFAVANFANANLFMQNSIDPLNPDIIIATVTSATAEIPAFVLGSPFLSPPQAQAMSNWTLGATTAQCSNQLFFDKSKPWPTPGNMTGCMSFNVSGGFNQNGVIANFTGAFDPAGAHGINAIGQSSNFAFLDFLNIPTLSEWGMIILALLMFSAAAVFIRRRQPQLAGAANLPIAAGHHAGRSIFDRALLFKSVLATVSLAALTLAVIAVFFGRPSLVDIFGTLLSSVVVGFLIHILLLEKNRPKA